MKEKEMVQIAIWMDRILKDPNNNALKEEIK